MSDETKPATQAASDRAIISVLGADRSGIVAAVAGLLAEQDVNILLRKEFGELDAAEACTDNDNTWFLLILLHDKSSPKTPTNEWRIKMIA